MNRVELLAVATDMALPARAVLMDAPSGTTSLRDPAVAWIGVSLAESLVPPPHPLSKPKALMRAVKVYVAMWGDAKFLI